ncbi:hypothetical protein B0I32_110211 [Nonomuraea fuscirosea]|uniref:DUF4386 domain-containing protein n=2 Tax=Nonomuraea fuscirosea TaxID=1291556 RepID=A0A2T0MXD6_9ACTN|nr:hypothetical protein B0I32_110211 [Nonomuraea fuscirosea]
MAAMSTISVRLGGVCAVLGAVGYLAAGALHRDLPSGAENAVPHVAAHPEWHAIHLLAILAVALWPIAFAGLAGVLTEGWSAILARIATGAVLVGFIIYVIDTALDGYVLKVVADTWAAASGTGKQDAFLIAAAVYRVLQATFVASIIWLVGVPFSLMGLAVAVGRAFPRWLGWAAFLVGLFVTTAGITYYLGFDAIPHLAGFVGPSGLLMIWMLVMGVLMTRSARRSQV